MRRATGRSPADLAALLLATLLLAPQPAAGQAGCTLTLPLNASASTLSFAGSAVYITSPSALTVPFAPANPAALVGMEGTLALLLPGGGPCPATAAEALSQLAGATLQTTGATGLLALYPVDGITISSTVANLTLQNNLFQVSSTPLAAGATAGAYSAVLSGTVVNGTVLSASLIATETLSMVGSNSTNATAVTAAAQGSTLSVTMTVEWTLLSPYTATIAGTAFIGVNNYVMRGQIVAQATLGCPGDCSAPNGRCATSEDGTVGCTCKCGWSGTNCELPSGFCSAFPAELTGQALVCPAVSAPAPEPEPGLKPCQPTACEERQEFSAASGQCECVPGWDGLGCNACQSDIACTDFFGVSGSTCSNQLPFQQGMQWKAYICELEGTGLEGIIQPGSFSMVCNTSALPAGQEAASSVDQACRVGFTLEQQSDNPVTCEATECSFKANSSRTDCVSTSCQCERESIADGCDVKTILDDVKGKPCSIECFPDGTCSFDIQDFIFQLVAPCTTAACVVPGYTFVEGDYKITTSQSYDPVIAAVPVMAVVALAAFLSLYLIRHRALFARGRSASAASAVGATSAHRRPADPVHLLTFDSVSCAVPLRQGNRWARCLPWGNKGDSEGPQQQQQQQQQRQTPAAAVAAEEGGAAGVPAGLPAQKLILQSVSGAAACGELVGVLGPSGSGKTTLLAILAGSSEDLDSSSSLTGSVLLDGQPLTTSNRRKIAYVAQDDSVLPTLTVEECVRYSAILRLPHAGAAEVQAAVQSVIAELGLQHVARSRVGGRSGIRGISGGERRRVTIAMELVTEPAVLVLDEPTSGLDSYTALQLMRSLKQVASGGRIVLLSFHQPSPAMFSLLDSTVLMAQGHCIFSGPPATADRWFATQGLPCPVGTAIAEHMLDAVSDPATLAQLLAQRAKQAGTATRAGTAAETPPQQAASLGTKGSQSSEDNSKMEGAPREAGSLSNGDGSRSVAVAAEAGAAGQAGAAGSDAPSWQRSLSRELAVVFWRTLVDIVRNPALLLLHWALALLMGAFVGAVFFSVTFDVSGAQNRVGAMFFVLCFFAFTSLTTVDLLMMERKMVLREVRGGYYRPGSYLLAKMVLDALLLRIIPVFVFSAAFYPMMGLQTGAATVATFLMVVAAFAGAMGALSLSVTVGSSTAGLASLIMNILLLTAVVVSGMLVNPESMPAWIRWTHWLSPFYYAYCSLMINEMSGIKIDFELKGYAAAQNVRGSVFLETIGINVDDLTRDIIVNDCYYLGLALLAFVLMYLVMPRPRWV